MHYLKNSNYGYLYFILMEYAMEKETKDLSFFNVHTSTSAEAGGIDADISFDELTDDEKIDIVAARVLKRFKPAFLELAK